MHRVSISIAAVAGLLLLACVEPLGEMGSGSLALNIDLEPGSLTSIDGGWVRLRGPTPSDNRDVPATPNQPVSIDELRPGQYRVILEGTVGGMVTHYVEIGPVTVVAGQTKLVTAGSFPTFVPAPPPPVPPASGGLTFTVTWPAVLHADSFRVEAATDPAFTQNRVPRTVPGSATTAQLTALVFGPHVVRVRAFSPTLAGQWSASQTIALTASDLVVSTTPTLSRTSVPQGDTVRLLPFTVNNQGTGATDAGIAIGFFLSADQNITTSDTRLGGTSIGGLGVTASFQVGAQLLTIPASTPTGSRFIGVLVDETNQIVEVNEGNNAQSASVSATAGADLVILGTVALSRTTGPQGDTLTVAAFTVRNQGTAPSNAGSVGVFLSTDPTVTVADPPLAGVPLVALAGGASVQVPAQLVTLPAATATGDYFVGVLIDETNQTLEANETNNAQATALTVVPGPDLVVSAPAVWSVAPTSVGQGDSVTLPAFTVQNQGTAATSSTIDIAFYLSTDQTITATDTRLGSGATVGSLAPGATANVASLRTSVPGVTTTGSYFIGVLVDYNGQQPESNEGNNFKSTSLAVTPGADLVISAPAVFSVTPTSVAQGDSVTLPAYTVKNQGTAITNAGAQVWLYLSTDQTITAADTRLAVGALTVQLAPGATATAISRRAAIPGVTTTGSYYIGYLVDDNDQIPESNEANNFVSTALTVTPGADLLISTATLTVTPNPARQGEGATLSAFFVLNAGTAPSHTNIVVGIYLSLDSTITTADTPLRTVGLTGLPGGASTQVGPLTLTIPASTVINNYFIGALVDEANQTAEANEGNNFKSRAVTVLPGADLVIPASPAVTVTPGNTTPGGNITLSAFNVSNLGTAVANSFRIGFYLSADTIISATNDVLLSTQASGPRAAGSTVTFGSRSLTIPAGTVLGQYFIGVLLDDQNAVLESNEVNNVRSAMLNVGLGTWTATGNMALARRDHTATRLTNGKVLIVGWFGTATELYDPATGTFSGTGALGAGRTQGATATLLANGKVLIVGGTSSPQTAELYDPATGIFSATGAPTQVRMYHAATLLANGRVLIAGGQNATTSQSFATAEVYDPATGAFTVTGSMVGDRSGHGAERLADGRVLVFGGGHIFSPGNATTLRSAELYDPANGAFSAVGLMQSVRANPSGVLLGNGQVLVVGWTGSGAELFNPATGEFSATGGMASVHNGAAVTLLSDGRVLVAGGATGSTILNSTEVYNASTGVFSAVASMGAPRLGHTATLLLNGKVLVVGGSNTTETASAELFSVP